MDAQTYINLKSNDKLAYTDSATIDELNALAASILKIAKAIDTNTIETYRENKRQYSKLMDMATRLRGLTYSK